MNRILPVLLLAAAGCAASPSPPPAAPPPAAPAGPPVPLSAERVGTLAAIAAARAGACLYDGGACVELPDGKSFWTFGDTFFGERGEQGAPDLVRFFGPAGPGDRVRSIRGAICQSFLVSTRADYGGSAPGALWLGAPGGPLQRGPLVPPPADLPDQESLRVWPMHGIHAGRVLLFYGVVRVLKDAAPPFNFDVLGIGLAIGDPEKGPLVPWSGPDGWRVFPADGPAYGAAVLQADMGITEGFDYVFGTKPGGYTNGVYVARVPHGHEWKPESWRYHRSGAEEWSPDPKAAEPIFDDAPGDLSVSWNDRLRKFVAVHSRCFSREVVMRVSDRPEGPWSAPTVLFEVPAPASGDRGFVYGGKEQIGLRAEGGRVLFVSAVDSREGVPGVWRITLP